MVLLLGSALTLPALANAPTEWQTLVRATTGDTPADTLRRVNQRINQLRRISDIRNWQRADHWTTPIELLQRGAGDCEDFAIAKYFLLRAHGFTDSNLRLMFARTYNPYTGVIEPHMVLLYLRHDNQPPLVLDNTRDSMQALDQRHDLVPTAAFDKTRYWIHDRQHWTSTHPATSLPAWQAVQQRWRQQTAGHLVASAQ